MTTIDRTTPESVALAVVRAIIDGDIELVATLSHVPEDERPRLEAEGSSYAAFLETMLSTGGPRTPSGERLRDVLAAQVDAGFSEVLIGDVPDMGRIAVAVMGEVGNKVMTVQMVPTDDGWALVGLPKAMPPGMLDALRG